MTFFSYREPEYYSFGLKAGISNLLRNGFHLGAKKTLGKLTQPINWYSRFPEYFYFDEAISQYLSHSQADGAKILDVGSPKTLGLLLAYRSAVQVTLTDISPLNIDEYRAIWGGLSENAKGKALFELQDGRSLTYPDEHFDVVYSMSVIEHIQGENGDAEAVRELIRVLKPGGLFGISVPFGTKYIEQEIVGRAGAVLPTNDHKSYFFQRIYDEGTFKERILASSRDLQSLCFHTVWRKNTWMHRGFARFGENVRGAFGFVNPLLSAMANESCGGVNTAFDVDYGPLHSVRDIYGDLIMTGIKAPTSPIS